MAKDSIDRTGFQPDAAADEHFFDSWFDPIEHALRDRARSFIEGLNDGEPAAVLRNECVTRPCEPSLKV